MLLVMGLWVFGAAILSACVAGVARGVTTVEMQVTIGLGFGLGLVMFVGSGLVWLKVF